MPNIFSKPTDKGQRTIDIYKANTSQGVFSGWGLSSLQQHNPTDGFTLIVLIYQKLGNHQRSGFVLVVKVTKNDNYLI